MDDTKALVIVLAMFLGFLTVSGALLTYDNYLKHQAIVEMVSKGADPIAARCAINMNSDMVQLCSTKGNVK